MAELPIIYHPLSPPEKPGVKGAAQDFGGGFKAFYMEEEVTLSLVGTTVTTNLIVPLGGLVVAVGARVTEAITKATTWSLGITSYVEHFMATNANVALGYHLEGCDAYDPSFTPIAKGPIASTNRTVLLTQDQTATAGKIRVGVAGFYFVPFTS